MEVWENPHLLAHAPTAILILKNTLVFLQLVRWFNRVVIYYIVSKAVVLHFCLPGLII